MEAYMNIATSLTMDMDEERQRYIPMIPTPAPQVITPICILQPMIMIQAEG